MKEESLNAFQSAILMELYKGMSETLDQLPYSPAFETLHAEFNKNCKQPLTKYQMWRGLLNLRKAKKLKRKVKNNKSDFDSVDDFSVNANEAECASA